MNTIDLEVQGMSCGSCVNHVTRALKPISGVTDVAVDLESGHVRVSGSFDDGAEPLISALANAGYAAKITVATASASSSNGPATHPNAGRGGCCCG